jgi:pimeloyl-ACP methyl ester carboxylesterase
MLALRAARASPVVPVASPAVLRQVAAPDGVRLAAEVSGQGPPLVMVHGAGSARWGFELVRPLLEPRFTVWALDRRGRGDSSDGGAASYDVEREFEDVAAAVEAAGPEALLFGHSYGALLAAGAARRLPGLRRLALYEPPMGGVLADESWVQRFEARVEAGEGGAAVRQFLHDIGGYSQDEIDAMEGTPVWDKRLEVAPTVPRELRAEHAVAIGDLGLERLDLPCLLLMGSESPDWARRSTHAFATALPGAELNTLDGHGHGAAVSAPELLAAELERFLLD